MLFLQFSISLLFTGLVSGQYPPEPKNLKTIDSNYIPGVTITYKEVNGTICDGNATSYAGYINFPPNSMRDAEQDHPAHIFFWYFESQNEPGKSPTSLWMNGGPGSGSLVGLLAENGPCLANSDSSSTFPNEYPWNKNVNMLYVDQPAQAGFSYDVLTNGTMDLKDGAITADKPGEPERSASDDPTLIRGTFGSQNPSQAVNTTVNAARQMWNFVQVWIQEFEPYVSMKKGHSPKSSQVNIWTESYGGRYGPGFAAYFQKQNGRVLQGAVPGEYLELDTVGVINGCVDILSQQRGNIGFAYDKNTYGFNPINKSMHDKAVAAFERKGGCLDQIKECQALATELDPQVYGNNHEANRACKSTSNYCAMAVDGYYVTETNRSFYDLTHCHLDPFPSSGYLGYLARAEVQQALGVPVNYSAHSAAVSTSFNLTGDYARRDIDGYLVDIAHLLDAGVKVALVYGDRDLTCNWVGGENVSLSIDYKDSEHFNQAGFARIITDDLAPNGDVRQYGKFSFSRVFQAGHMVPSYRPLVAYEIFHRTMFNKDIETGRIDVTDQYSTSGEQNSTHTESILPTPLPTCYLRDMASTCSQNQIVAVQNNNTSIVDNIIVFPTQAVGVCPEGNQ